MTVKSTDANGTIKWEWGRDERAALPFRLWDEASANKSLVEANHPLLVYFSGLTYMILLVHRTYRLALVSGYLLASQRRQPDAQSAFEVVFIMQLSFGTV